MLHRRQIISSALAMGVASTVAGGCQSFGATPPSETDPFLAAFYYAFPLYEFARVEQERSGALNGQAGRLNTITHRAQLMDHTSHQVTAPNNDTIYSSSFLELSGGPVELFVPSSDDRYFSVAFMQAFTDVFAYIGTRATDGRGGRFWVVGPGWQGSAPAEVQVIRAPTNDVWMLMRTLVDGPQDLEAARTFQEQLVISETPDRGPTRGFLVAATDVNDPEIFLGLVNEVIARTPQAGGLMARAAQFAPQGVGVAGLASSQVLGRWRTIIPEALEILRETFRFRDFAVDGWSYQPPGVADFGDNDLLRAAVALGGIAALGEEEAMYFHANFDIQGNPLTGDHAYRWRLPAGGVPVDGFWSLTLYEVTPEGRYFFTENPINRYAIGDRTPGLIANPDGSCEILIQRERPSGPLAANWLPAPTGRLRLALRAYLPRRELRERTWRVPALRRLDPT